jgi:integrase
VRVRSYPQRPGTPWTVDLPAKQSPTGKRSRKYFKTEGEAQAWIDHHKKESLQHGTLLSQLPGALRVRLAACLERAGSVDKIESLLAGIAPADQLVGLTVVKAAEEFTRAKQAEGVGLGQWRDLRAKLKVFSSRFGGQDVAAMTTPVLSEWINDLKYSTGGRQGFHKVLRSFFRWLRRVKRAVKINPMEDVPRPRSTRDDKKNRKPGILSIEEMSALLRVKGPILRYIVLGGFVGCRTEEITGNQDHRGIHAEEIDLKRKDLRITDEVSKTREWIVPLHPTAIAWLKLCELPKSGPVVPWLGTPFARERDKAVKKAGVKLGVWPKNALRHSFASYDLAAFEDLARTVFRMRHTTAQTTFQHYRRLVTKREGKAWWALTPEKVLKR